MPSGPSAVSIARNTRPLRPDPLRAASSDCVLRLSSDSLHDLMSPVNQMGTMLDLILQKRGDSLDDELKVLFGFVHKAALRLQNLMGGLSTYMRVVGPAGVRCRCDANALLDAAIATLRPLIDLNGALVTHDPLPELWCDPSQLTSTFVALIENAIKFRREVRPELHISARGEGDGWLFTFRDNGIGIDPNFSERIFAVFKRIGNDTYAGSGVGLAIARQVVEDHGGRIWVDPTPGPGATVCLTLPRDQLQS